MTEGRDPTVLYLDKEGIERIHALLSAWAVRNGDEPIPEFKYAKQNEIEALVSAPQRRFADREAYPTLEEKAAILFYTVNKQQIFLNGNKRMSTLCLLVFLGINNKTLSVTPDELTAKALCLAKTDALLFPAIKQELVEWIREHLVNISDIDAGAHAA